MDRFNQAFEGWDSTDADRREKSKEEWACHLANQEEIG